MYWAWVKEDMQSEAMGLIEEYKLLFEGAMMSTPYNVFRNVFGDATNCIVFRQTYKDAAAWAAATTEMYEKVDQEKLQDLFGRWSNVLVKGEDHEYWENKELTHVQQEL